MLVKILNKFNCQSFPIDNTAIEVSQEILDQIGVKYCFDVENNCVVDYDNTQDLEIQTMQELRLKREIECFPIINRGKLWYDKLTNSQLEELDKWYNDWLNVTETLIEPSKPAWLTSKSKKEV